MSYATLLIEKKEQIGTIVFNRPEMLNAFSQLGFREFIQALKEMDADDGIRVVIITGSGRAFSAGLDIDEARQGPPETGLQVTPLQDTVAWIPHIMSEHAEACHRFDQRPCGRGRLHHCPGVRYSNRL